MFLQLVVKTKWHYFFVSFVKFVVETLISNEKLSAVKKKPCYPHGQQGLAKSEILNGTFQSKYDVCL